MQAEHDRLRGRLNGSSEVISSDSNPGPDSLVTKGYSNRQTARYIEGSKMEEQLNLLQTELEANITPLEEILVLSGEYSESNKGECV